MDATFRLATQADAPVLWDLRRKAIVALASARMPVSAAEAWAANLTMVGMEEKIREFEIWVIERDNVGVAMRDRGFSVIHADASPNAVEFYLHRGI